MDDSIRPMQANKRRSAHGEKPLFFDAFGDTLSVHVDTEVESVVYSGKDEDGEEEDDKNKTNPATQSNKRSRRKPHAPEPTRRSSRKRLNSKVAYRTDIHPQDQALQASSDEDDDVLAPIAKRTKLPVTVLLSNSIELEGNTGVSIQSEPGSDVMEGATGLVEEEKDALIKTSSPLSSVATPPPPDIRRKEGMDIWMLVPGQRYFLHDQDSWPATPGLPFQIYSERLEDQLAAEAKAASPLNYDHDDKENDTIDPETETSHDPLNGMSIMPASHYRRTSGESLALQPNFLVEHAFYNDFGNSLSPYGLGGSDGTHDEHDHAVERTSALECMRILASGQLLPRAPVSHAVGADDIDSVIGLFSSSDSVQDDSASRSQS